MNESNYFVYILYSKTSDVYYRGITQNIEKRFSEHNENKSRYTSSKGPWVLVYTKSYLSKKEALIEERRLKKLNRDSLISLISKL
ncbi:MAG: GIY-YIG nuclease family protein [Saprospiraceae bacterium]|nr:GIY-YIG nuclease family protein [Saprospiraceae bacterium]